jgi:excisionase family DNA binding protein
MLLTTKELADKVRLTPGRINQMIWSGEIEAEKRGRDYLIDDKYVEIIKNRPEKRGKYMRNLQQTSLREIKAA